MSEVEGRALFVTVSLLVPFHLIGPAPFKIFLPSINMCFIYHLFLKQFPPICPNFLISVWVRKENLTTCKIMIYNRKNFEGKKLCNGVVLKKKKFFLGKPTKYIQPSSPLPDMRMKVTLWKLEIWKQAIEGGDDKTCP